MRQSVRSLWCISTYTSHGVANSPAEIIDIAESLHRGGRTCGIGRKLEGSRNKVQSDERGAKKKPVKDTFNMHSTQEAKHSPVDYGWLVVGSKGVRSARNLRHIATIPDGRQGVIEGSVSHVEKQLVLEVAVGTNVRHVVRLTRARLDVDETRVDRERSIADTLWMVEGCLDGGRLACRDGYLRLVK
jgi:hypothetical protein